MRVGMLRTCMDKIVHTRDGVPIFIHHSELIFGIIFGITMITIVGFKPIILAFGVIAYDIFANLWTHAISRYITNRCTMKELNYLHAWYKDDWSTNYDDKELEIFDQYVWKKMNALKEEKKVLKETKSETIEMKTVMESQSANFDYGMKLLYEFKYKTSNVQKWMYDNICQKADDLSKELKKNPKGYVFVDTTFTTFTEEFIALLTSFLAMGSDIDKENREKMKTLLKSYYEYLERTIDKVKNQNQMNIDIAYDVVIKNLNKTNKEGDEQIG